MSKHMNLVSEMTKILETKVDKNGEISITKNDEKIIVLKYLVHCADLANPTMELPVYQHWVKGIMAEFFSQGDIEKSLGMTTILMCDRETASIEMNQISFINGIVIPISDIWSQLVHPHADFIMKQINMNKEYYQNIIDLNINNILNMTNTLQGTRDSKILSLAFHNDDFYLPPLLTEKDRNELQYKKIVIDLEKTQKINFIQNNKLKSKIPIRKTPIIIKQIDSDLDSFSDTTYVAIDKCSSIQSVDNLDAIEKNIELNM
ncbi:hypothetical protein A3Q56_07289, partial [Intoshia linei]